MSNRYQKEIQDILDEANQHSKRRGDGINITSIPRMLGLVKDSLGRFGRYTSGSFSFHSPGGLLVLGVSVIILGWISRYFDAMRNLAGLVMWLGVILAILSYIRYFTRPRNPVVRKWRQQIIEDDDLLSDSAWNSLKRFFK